MENKKAKKVPLNDELLDRVSGGTGYDYGDDPNLCAWNPNGPGHEWIIGENGIQTCLFCGVYI